LSFFGRGLPNMNSTSLQRFGFNPIVIFQIFTNTKRIT
jgi:hypothetical protein